MGLTNHVVVAEFVNDKRLNHVPGPDTYATPAKDKVKMPEWGTSKEKRFADRKYGNPGPGNYEYRVHTADGPRFTTRPKPAINPFKNRTETGPGDYNPRVASYNVQYSISNRLSWNPDKNTPGPGSYDDGRQLYYRTMVGSKIGREVRKGEFLRTASFMKQEPGKYELKGFANDIYVGVPNCKFGIDSKSKSFKEGVPGPGRYDELRNIGKEAPAFSMPGRRKDHVSIER